MQKGAEVGKVSNELEDETNIDNYLTGPQIYFLSPHHTFSKGLSFPPQFYHTYTFTFCCFPKTLIHSFIKINLFIYFWLHWVFIAVHRLSLVAASRGTLHCGARASHCSGFSSLQSMGSRRTGFSSCGTQAQWLWCTGLLASWHVGSSRTRARIRVPCIGRRILNHCDTREVPLIHSL